jgi:hypothetical protein
VKRQYLGDSYDAVKHLWQEVLAEWAPLHAEPRFIPEDIRSEFTTFTRIPLLNEHRPTFYAILNDPDTGIRLPNLSNQSEGRSHIAFSTIREQLRNTAVRCVITFDQSKHREPGLSLKSQRNAKLQWLQRQRLSAFYYVSHAPFLFAFSEPARMNVALGLIRRAGVPADRIEEQE